MYKVWLQEKHLGMEPVLAHYYADVLKKHISNLSFTKPKCDTCKQCDIFDIMLKQTLTEDERRTTLKNLEHHQLMADKGYGMPKKILEEAGNDVMVVCMHLQRALLTPKLSTGIAFYKRKMWTYNFCVHNYRTGTGHMFMGDEIAAKRGASEIASCVNTFIKKYVPPTVRKLVTFSNNCSCQNKNFTLILFYLYLIYCDRFYEVDHIYFQSGHTYMQADGDFSSIETAKRNCQYLYTPEDYVNLVKTCRRKKKFVVQKMSQEDFLEWDVLKAYVTKRTNPEFTFLNS